MRFDVKKDRLTGATGCPGQGGATHLSEATHTLKGKWAYGHLDAIFSRKPRNDSVFVSSHTLRFTMKRLAPPLAFGRSKTIHFTYLLASPTSPMSRS